MTVSPILSALVAPGGAAPARRGREPASDAGAAFLAVLAGLFSGGTPPRHGAAAGAATAAAPAAGRVDGSATVAGAKMHVPGAQGRPRSNPAATPEETGPEGTTIMPIAPAHDVMANAAVARRHGLGTDPGGRGSETAGRVPAGVDLATGRVPAGIELAAGRGVEAATGAAQTATPSDVMARAGQLQLPGAGPNADPALLDGGRTAAAASDPAAPRPDALAELREASGVRPERAAAPEAMSPSRPSAPAPTPASQMGIEITRAVAQRIDHMVVRMQPPELGQVRIELSFGNDGQLSARIAVDRVETLEILQRDAHTLERALQDAGLRTDSGGLSFSLRRDPNESGEPDQHPAQAPADDLDGTAAEPEADAGRDVAGLRLLDIRA